MRDLPRVNLRPIDRAGDRSDVRLRGRSRRPPPPHRTHEERVARLCSDGRRKRPRALAARRSPHSARADLLPLVGDERAILPEEVRLPHHEKARTHRGVLETISAPPSSRTTPMKNSETWYWPAAGSARSVFEPDEAHVPRLVRRVMRKTNTTLIVEMQLRPPVGPRRPNSIAKQEYRDRAFGLRRLLEAEDLPQPRWNASTSTPWVALTDNRFITPRSRTGRPSGTCATVVGNLYTTSMANMS